MTRSITDLWELDDHRRAEVVTDRLESNFYVRCPPERRPARLRLRLSNNDKDTAGAIGTSDATGDDDNDEKGLGALEAGAASPDPDNKRNNKKTKPQYDSSLPLALQRTFFFPFWLSGILYAIGGMSTLHSLCARHGV